MKCASLLYNPYHGIVLQMHARTHNNFGCWSHKFFHFISFIISQGTKKKQLQNETDIKNANMFKWYNDYTRHNYRLMKFLRWVIHNWFNFCPTADSKWLVITSLFPPVLSVPWQTTITPSRWKQLGTMLKPITTCFWHRCFSCSSTKSTMPYWTLKRERRMLTVKVCIADMDPSGSY